jgi:hypothetical protein
VLYWLIGNDLFIDGQNCNHYSEVEMTGATKQIWRAFAASVGAELREDTKIRGQSGLEHEVQAIAVDDKTGRLIIVTAEADPRMAALVQVDVQASIPDAKVLIARPIAIDISLMARELLEPFNIHEIDFERARNFIDKLNSKEDNEAKALVAPLADGTAANLPKIFEKVDLPIIGQIVSVISQSEMLPWKDIWRFLSESASAGKIDFRSLLARDSLAADLAAGICPIPLYKFSEADLELFLNGQRVDECRELLKRNGIYQYFYPAQDQLALALIENGLSDKNEILRDSQLAPEMGHPFGEMEILDQATNVKDLIDTLSDRKLVVEGEFGFEVSPEGKTVRGHIKFAPREGLVTKILNRISVNLSSADFIK